MPERTLVQQQRTFLPKSLPAGPAPPAHPTIVPVNMLSACVTRDFEVLQVSAPFEQVSGHRAADAVGHNLVELLLLKDVVEGDLEAALNAVKSGSACACTASFLNKQGLRFVGNVIFSPMVSTNEDEPVVMVVLDPSEVHRQEPLKSSLPDTLAEAMRPSTQARIITDDTGTITFVNNAWVQLCGYSACEAQGRTLSLIQGPKTNLAELRQMLKKVKAGAETTTDVINYKKDGTAFTNRLQVKALRPGDEPSANVPMHFIGVLTEVA